MDGGDVRGQGPVVAQEGGALADAGQDLLEARAGFERLPQVDALGGRQEFDGDDLADVPGDLGQSARCRSAASRCSPTPI